MKRIQFSQTFFETDGSGNHRPRFEAGKHYPADDAEAQRCVARGIAEEVDVPDPEPEQPAAEAGAPAPAPSPEATAAAPAPAAKAKK